MYFSFDTKPKKVLMVLSGAVLLITAMSLFGQYPGPEALYDSDNLSVDNLAYKIANWYIFSVLFCSALLLAYISKSPRKNLIPRQRIYWISLTILFLLLSLEEAVYLHERIIMMFHHVLLMSRKFVFVQTITGIIVIMLFLVVFRPFLAELSRQFRVLFAVSITIFTAGAFCLEPAGIYYAGTSNTTALIHNLPAALAALTSMLGATLCFYTLHKYIHSDMKIPEWGIDINPKKLACLLISVMVLLAVFSLIGRYIRIEVINNAPTLPLRLYVDLTNVDHEHNIPTWYSSSGLLSAALLLGFIGGSVKTQDRRQALYWASLAMAFIFLSLDETISMHEVMAPRLRDAIWSAGFRSNSLLYSLWIIPALTSVLLLGGVYLPFISSLPRKICLLFIVSGLIYLSGALALEFVGELIADAYGTKRTMAFSATATMAELFEMIGVILFIYTLLTFINTHINLKRSVQGSGFKAERL